MASELFNKGLAVRKSVLGSEYVEKSLAGADDFAMAMQTYATEAAWGMIWTRPGLPRKTRSLINLAMISALNRPNELKLHIRSAFNNGVTQAEIKEVLLQVAAYCGVPAGIDSFRLAKEVFADMKPRQKVTVKVGKAASQPAKKPAR
jgi:4-carboxymuconolactone decarboxylase